MTYKFIDFFSIFFFEGHYFYEVTVEDNLQIEKLWISQTCGQVIENQGIHTKARIGARMLDSDINKWGTTNWSEQKSRCLYEGTRLHRLHSTAFDIKICGKFETRVSLDLMRLTKYALINIIIYSRLYDTNTDHIKIDSDLSMIINVDRGVGQWNALCLTCMDNT